MTSNSSQSPATLFDALMSGPILVPIDMRHAQASDKSVAMAADLARHADCALHILTVAHPFGVHLSETADAARPAFEAHVSALSERHGLSILGHFHSHESPEQLILDVVRDQNVGLVVMATHDPRLSDHIFGSYAARIVRDAPCSVLVVR